jgi:hypothetical protein
LSREIACLEFVIGGEIGDASGQLQEGFHLPRPVEVLHRPHHRLPFGLCPSEAHGIRQQLIGNINRRLHGFQPIIHRESCNDQFYGPP